MRLMHSTIIAAAVLFTGAAQAADERPSGELVVMCPMIYLPVCASDGKVTKIFPNKCTAEHSGFELTSPEACGGAPDAVTQSCEDGKPCVPVRPRGIGKMLKAEQFQ